MEIRLSQALGPVKLALMDTAVQTANRRLRVLGNKSPCGPGCSNCCSRLVHISVAEGILIYERLVKNGKWLNVRKNAREQFPIIHDIHPLTWFKMNRPCPVLDPDTKTCRTYEVRPAACSTHFVSSDPKLCSPWSTSTGDYKSEDMSDLLESFQKRLEECVDGFGILKLELPLPVALLLAERISIQSFTELDKAVSMLFNEFR
jgi:Fe-S-cluster containining protein